MTDEEIAALVKAAVLAERQACALLCLQEVWRPAGYKGRWEGYGGFMGLKDGVECGDAIMARPPPDEPNLTDGR